MTPLTTWVGLVVLKQPVADSCAGKSVMPPPLCEMSF
jgi:hypothetical protein